MVRIPGDHGPGIKNRSSKHRMLLRDLPRPSKRKAVAEKKDNKSNNK